MATSTPVPKEGPPEWPLLPEHTEHASSPTNTPEELSGVNNWGIVSISAAEAEKRYRSDGKWPDFRRGLKEISLDKPPKPNQDAWAADEETGVIAVADGTGSYDGSEKAAKLATSSFVQDAGEQIKRLLSGEEDFENAKAKVAQAVQQADQKILEAQKNGEMPRGATTTLTGVAIFTDPHSGKKTAIAVNAGDSATYLLRGDKLIALTTEQSVGGNMLTNYLGGEEGSNSREVRERHQISMKELQPDDRLILCTDCPAPITLDSIVYNSSNTQQQVMEASICPNATSSARMSKPRS